MKKFQDPDKFAFGDQLKKSKPLTIDILEKLQGKPFYGEYEEGDVILYFMLHKNKGTKNGMGMIEISIEPIVERTLNRLNREYSFVRFATGNKLQYPIFE